jgi:hypothetical protein
MARQHRCTPGPEGSWTCHRTAPRGCSLLSWAVAAAALPGCLEGCTASRPQCGGRTPYSKGMPPVRAGSVRGTNVSTAAVRCCKDGAASAQRASPCAGSCCTRQRHGALSNARTHAPSAKQHQRSWARRLGSCWCHRTARRADRCLAGTAQAVRAEAAPTWWACTAEQRRHSQLVRGAQRAHQQGRRVQWRSLQCTSHLCKDYSSGPGHAPSGADLAVPLILAHTGGASLALHPAPGPIHSLRAGGRRQATALLPHACTHRVCGQGTCCFAQRMGTAG